MTPFEKGGVGGLNIPTATNSIKAVFDLFFRSEIADRER